MNHKFIYLVTGFDSIFLKRFILIIFCFWVKYSGAQTAKELLDIGWHELIMDHDTTAIQFFEQANLKATQEKNDEIKAKSFLYAGFASYGTSYSNGLQYCLKAMEIYKKTFDWKTAKPGPKMDDPNEQRREHYRQQNN